MKHVFSGLLAGLTCVLSMAVNADPAFVFQADTCYPVFTPQEGAPIQLVGDRGQGVAVTAGYPEYAAGKATCQGTHSVPLDHAEVQRGSCYFPNSPLGPLIVEDGQLVMTPDGNFTLFCKFNRPNSHQDQG